MEERPRFPYGYLVTESLKILWRNPILWILGALFSLSGGAIPNGGNVSAFDTGGGGGEEPPKEFVRDVETGIDSALKWMGDHLALIIGIIIGLLVLWTIIWLIGMFFGSALIAGTREAAEGRKPRFRECLSLGRPPYWRFVGLAAIFNIVSFLVVAAAIIPVVIALARSAGAKSARGGDVGNIVARILEDLASGTMDPMVIAALALMVLLIVPVSLLLYWWKQISSRAVILDGSPIFASIARGFLIFRATPGRSILVLLISQLAGIAALLALTLALIPCILPGLAVVFLIAFTSSSMLAVAITIGVVAALILIVALLFLGGVAETFFAAYWTLSYRSLTPYLVSLETAGAPAAAAHSAKDDS